MSNDWWNYSVWMQFQNKIYHESLSKENLLQDGSELMYETVYKIDDQNMVFETIIEPAEDRSVVLMKKGSDSYMLPVRFAKMLPIRPVEYFRCQIKKSDKTVYKFITLPSEMKIGPDKADMTFKQFISQWNPMAHTSEKDWIFIKCVAIASKYKGTKLCLCSEPSAGKNSNFTLLNCTTEDVCRIQKPTLAKFETICYYNKVVLPDEMTSLQAAQIHEIEPMILWLGDNSPEYNKHSMAQNKLLNKIDIVNLSVIFTYNRKQDLSEGAVFFDDIWQNKAAFKSRYPQFLISGKINEPMMKYSTQQAQDIMTVHWQDMRKMAKAMVYWTQNIHIHLHHWTRDKLRIGHRHYANVESILDVLDVYSESQEEYDSWMIWMQNSMIQYKFMVKGQENIDLRDFGEEVLVTEQRLGSDDNVRAVSYSVFIDNVKQISEPMPANKIRMLYANGCDELIFDTFMDKAKKEGVLYEKEPDKWGLLR